MEDHMYTGFKVIDFSQVIAGPKTTGMMAEMGADVIKVELAPGGDPSRQLPFHVNGRSGCFMQQNRGKRSLCLDRKAPESIEILKALIAESDVMIENYAAGVIQRMGFGWEEVKKINPQIIMCSISAFGQTGPLADLPGYDYIAASYAGVLDMIGEADGSPLWPFLALGDGMTGVHALAAISTALLNRTKTGKGRYIDVSLLDCYFHMHELNVQVYSGSRGKVSPKRNGPHHYALAPCGVFKSKNGYVYLIALPAQWPKLCELMGMPELAEDPRFNSLEIRGANQKELVAIIESWMQEQNSDEDIIEQFREARLAIAPVLSVAEAMAHPHMIQRGTVRTIQDDVYGDLQIPGMPLRFSGTTNNQNLKTAYLGQHNREILTTDLGYDNARVDELEAAGILVSIPEVAPEPAA